LAVLSTLGGLLGQEIWKRVRRGSYKARAMGLTLVNVGQNTTLGDGDVAEKLVQFLIVADGKLEMTGDDTGLLVVTGGVTGQLEDFGSQVLKDGSQVDGGT
jgi:hypothetical protein